MYHANAWGLPYVAAAVGAKLVFNGASFDPAVLLDLIRSFKVSGSSGAGLGNMAQQMRRAG